MWWLQFVSKKVAEESDFDIWLLVEDGNKWSKHMFAPYTLQVSILKQRVQHSQTASCMCKSWYKYQSSIQTIT